MAATTRVPGLTVAFLSLFIVFAIGFGDILAALAAGGQGALAVLYVGGGGLRRTSDWLHRIGPRRRSHRVS
jgi:hypothetical protein